MCQATGADLGAILRRGGRRWLSMDGTLETFQSCRPSHPHRPLPEYLLVLNHTRYGHVEW
jgi:hypothetical protein